MTNIPVWIAWLKYLSFVYYGEHHLQMNSCSLMKELPASTRQLKF